MPIFTNLTKESLDLTEIGVKFRYDIVLEDGTEITGFYKGDGEVQDIYLEEANKDNEAISMNIRRVKDIICKNTKAG